jgi:hypothetical protein
MNEPLSAFGSNGRGLQRSVNRNIGMVMAHVAGSSRK